MPNMPAMKFSGMNYDRDHGENLHDLVETVVDGREVSLGEAGDDLAVGLLRYPWLGPHDRTRSVM